MSKTSSRKPRRVAIINEMMDERYTESCERDLDSRRKGFVEGTNLVMREFIDGETMHGFLLVAESIGEDIGKSERDEEDQGQYVYRSAYETLTLWALKEIWSRRRRTDAQRRTHIGVE